MSKESPPEPEKTEPDKATEYLWQRHGMANHAFTLVLAGGSSAWIGFLITVYTGSNGGDWLLLLFCIIPMLCFTITIIFELEHLRFLTDFIDKLLEVTGLLEVNNQEGTPRELKENARKLGKKAVRNRRISYWSFLIGICISVSGWILWNFLEIWARINT